MFKSQQIRAVYPAQQLINHSFPNFFFFFFHLLVPLPHYNISLIVDTFPFEYLSTSVSSFILSSFQILIVDSFSLFYSSSGHTDNYFHPLFDCSLPSKLVSNVSQFMSVRLRPCSSRLEDVGST